MAGIEKTRYDFNMLHRKTVIFDLDGTLIHSAPDLQAAVNIVLNSLGRRSLELQTIVSFIGDGVEKLVERSLQETGVLTDVIHQKALEVFLESYAQNMTPLTHPYPGVVRVLDELHAAGIRLGICTNKPTGPAREICDQLGLARFFDVIVGAEPGQAKKPDPSSLLRCIAKLEGKRASSIYVGDSAVDYETAINAKVPFRLFSGGYLNTDLPTLSVENRFSAWETNGILDLLA